MHHHLLVYFKKTTSALQPNSEFANGNNVVSMWVNTLMLDLMHLSVEEASFIVEHCFSSSLFKIMQDEFGDERRLYNAAIKRVVGHFHNKHVENMLLWYHADSLQPEDVNYISWKFHLVEKLTRQWIKWISEDWCYL